MPAYIIFTREKMRDADAFKDYKALVPASQTGHPITARVRYGRYEVMEGAAMEGVVVLEFPTFDDAKAWYQSPAYREAREHRFRGADYRVVIVEGV